MLIQIQNFLINDLVVRVYDANTKEFLSYESSVKDCEMKYNISRTHLKRVRKYNQAYQGKLFSNHKLKLMYKFYPQ